MKFHKDKLEFQGWIVGKDQVREIISGRATRVVCECDICAKEDTVRDVTSSRQPDVLVTGCQTFSKDEITQIEKWLATKTPPLRTAARKAAAKKTTRARNQPAKKKRASR